MNKVLDQCLNGVEDQWTHFQTKEIPHLYLILFLPSHLSRLSRASAVRLISQNYLLSSLPRVLEFRTPYLTTKVSPISNSSLRIFLNYSVSWSTNHVRPNRILILSTSLLFWWTPCWILCCFILSTKDLRNHLSLSIPSCPKSFRGLDIYFFQENPWIPSNTFFADLNIFIFLQLFS